MSSQEIMIFDSALEDVVLRRVERIARTDIIVGIPSYRNARTIGRVARAASKGLQTYFPETRAVLVNADGGSSDDTGEIVESISVGSHVEKLSFVYRGLLGKGTGVRGILEITERLGAKVCVILEPDIMSVTPRWIRELAQPILDGGFDLVAPLYQESIPLAAVNDIIVYPLTRLLYGGDCRKPLGANLAMSGDLAGDMCQHDVWETDIARYGVDVWLTTAALTEGQRLCQTQLGTRRLSGKEDSSTRNPRFLQLVGTLFRMMGVYRRQWQEGRKHGSISIINRATKTTAPLEQDEEVDVEAFVASVRSGDQEHGWAWRSALRPDDYAAVREILSHTPAHWRFPLDTWARIVIDFAVVYNRGESDPDKIAQALLPLYYARMIDFMYATEGKNALEIEEIIQAQAKAFFDHRDYLLERWDSYIPWVGELPRRRGSR